MYISGLFDIAHAIKDVARAIRDCVVALNRIADKLSVPEGGESDA